RSTSNVHQASVWGEIQASGNLLPLENTGRIHQLGETPQAHGIFVEGRKGFCGRGAEGLLPAWAVFAQRVREVLAHAVKGATRHGNPMEGVWRIRCKVRAQRGIVIAVVVTFYQAELPQRDQETPTPLGVEVELSGQRVGCGCTMAERIEQAEINGRKQDLRVHVGE